jgi:hypothetical protein
LWSRKAKTDTVAAAMKDSALCQQLTMLSQMPFGMGAALIMVARAHEVTMAIDPVMRGGLFRVAGSDQSVTVGPGMHAGVLGHELRHAWQHNEIPIEKQLMKSPRDALAHIRLVEADARAVGIFLGMQDMRMRGRNQKAAEEQSIDDLDRMAVRQFYRHMDRAAGKPEDISIMLRMMFEMYMRLAPTFEAYERMAVDHLLSMAEGNTARKVTGGLVSLFNRSAGKYMAHSLTAAQPDPDAIRDFTDSLGQFPGGAGNYLANPRLVHDAMDPRDYGRPGPFTHGVVGVLESRLK